MRMGAKLIEARYLGQHARTGAMIGITTDGIVCGRLGRRLPEAERWDQTGWQDLKGVPWDLRPTGVPAPEPVKKTARGRDPRTRERKEQCQQQAERTPSGDKELEQVTCESDVKQDREAESKAAAVTAVASNKKARATFEGQSSDRIAKSDVVKDTMPATVKVAKEIDELDISQPTAECHLMAWPHKRMLDTREMSSGPCRVEQKTPMSVS